MGESKNGALKDLVVTTTELAGVLGLSARRVQQLIQDGILVTVSRGKLLLGDSIQRYITYITGGEKTQQEKSEEQRIELVKSQAEAQYKASRAAVAKLEAQELQGKMHRAEDVEAVTEDLVYTIRSGLNALPGRCAVDVAAASTPAEASEIIRKEVDKLMDELSRHHYSPKKYEDLVRGRRSWSGREDMNDEQ